MPVEDSSEIAAPYAVDESGVVHVGPADATDDYGTFINSLFADPAVTEVHLDGGVFQVSSGIVVPSGKSLVGAGRDLTLIEAASDFQPISSQHNGVVNSEWGATNVSMSDFSVDAGKVLPDGLRINGVLDATPAMTVCWASPAMIC